MSVWLTLILFLIRCVLSIADIREMIDAGNIAELGYSVFGYAGE